jgi:hypothetical protein
MPQIKRLIIVADAGHSQENVVWTSSGWQPLHCVNNPITYGLDEKEDADDLLLDPLLATTATEDIRLETVQVKEISLKW